ARSSSRRCSACQPAGMRDSSSGKALVAGAATGDRGRRTGSPVHLPFSLLSHSGILEASCGRPRPMPSHSSAADLHAVIARHWGFSSLRPLQDQAMRAVLDGRDSLVVLPTGGGKSLCYQAPAVLQGGLTVVVSPLIALMKDQVDGLRACGVNAAQLDRSL